MLDERYDIDPYAAFRSATLTPVADYFNPTNNAEKYNAWNKEIADQKDPEPPKMYQPPADDTASKYNAFNQQMSEQATPEPITPATTEKQAATPEDRIKSLLSSFPEPKYDQARQDRLKKLAKVQAFGEGLKLIGDTFALSRGARVRPRNSSDVQNTYIAWQNYEDAYANRLDQHNREKFNLTLRELARGEDNDWRKMIFERDQQRWDENKKMQEDYRKEQMEFNREKEANDQAVQATKFAIDAQKYAEKMKLDWSKLGIQQQRLLKSLADSEARTNKPYMRVNLNGKEIGLSEGESRKYYEEAKKYFTANGKFDAQAFEATYQNQPVEAQKELVNRYLLEIYGKPQTITNSWTDTWSNTRPAYNGPVPAGQPVNTLNPVQSPTQKEYSTGGYY